jgi:hypothetical protein
MASHHSRVAERGTRRAPLLLGVGVVLAWSVPVMVTLSAEQPVRVDAVVAWLGLVGFAFLVGLSLWGSLPRGLGRDRTRPRTRGDRHADMVTAMFLLAVSVSLTAQGSWGHWYALLQVGAALAAGFKLAAATGGPADLGRLGYHWHPEMSD